MSTHIEHGYRLALPPDDLFLFLDRARNVLEGVYQKRTSQLLASLATSALDHLTLGGALAGEPKHEESLRKHRSPIRYARSVLQDTHQHIRVSGTRSPELDLQCELVFLVDPERPSQLFALLYTEQECYHAAWQSLPGVVHWPYWNHTDAPAGVSEEEWEQRREEWLRTVGNSPARRGLTWRLLGDHLLLPGLDDALLYVPSDEERAKALAYSRAAASLDWSAWPTLPSLEDLQEKALTLPSCIQELTPLSQATLKAVPLPGT